VHENVVFASVEDVRVFLIIRDVSLGQHGGPVGEVAQVHHVAILLEAIIVARQLLPPTVEVIHGWVHRAPCPFQDQLADPYHVTLELIAADDLDVDSASTGFLEVIFH